MINWNAFQPNFDQTREHRQWSRFHALTLAWLDEPSATLSSLPDRQILKEAALPLSNLLHGALPALNAIGSIEWQPEEALAQLPHTLQVIQAWSLRRILDSQDPSRHEALLNMLQQISWKAGRNVALEDWKDLPESERTNLRRVFDAASITPFMRELPKPTTLVLRKLPDEVEWEWLDCPHLTAIPEVRPVADPLCKLHQTWVLGFLYGISPKIIGRYTRIGRPGRGCRCLWTIAEN